MKQAALAAVATGVALAGCATSGTATDARYYRCRVGRAAGPGTLNMIVDVEQDGRRQDHNFRWNLRSPRNEAQIQIEWFHVLPPAPADDMRVTFTLRRTWRARFVRVVLLRGEEGLQSRTVMGPTYGRDLRSASVTTDLSHLREFLAGAPHLTVGIVDANGGLLAQHRIEPAMFGRAAQAIADARPEIEAMVGDYRNRCELTAPDRILLT